MVDEEQIRNIIEAETGAKFVEFPPIPEDMPLTVNLDRYDERDKPLVASCVTVLRDFIQAPLLVDDLTDHGEREARRTQMIEKATKEYGEDTAEYINRIATRNKLKRNFIGTLSLAADSYTMVGRESEAGKEIKSILSNEVNIAREYNPDTGDVQTVDPWAKKTLDEKKVVLADLTNLSVQFLKDING